MKKVAMCFLGALFILGISGFTQAQNTREPALADIIPVGCNDVQIAPYDASLLVSWDWENGTTQTKFGGDAVFKVEVAVNDLVEFVTVEIPIVKYEPGTPAEDYEGMLVYRCSVPQTEVTGSCNGAILGLNQALENAVIAELGLLPEDAVVIESYEEPYQVLVKAMNPSFEEMDDGNNKIKRQNFPLVDVCDADTPI